MRAVHQAVAAATPGDAVTGQALAWRGLLREWGHPSEIVSEFVHPDLAGEVVPLDTGGANLLAEGAVVLHYSIWSRVVEAVTALRVPLVLVYHNVTPGDLMRPANPELADLCDQARSRLARLRGTPDVLVADSSFNAADLREAGLGEATVVPLLLDLPNGSAPLREPKTHEPVVLTVGRVAPNKRLEDVVKAFALYQRTHAPRASLAVVGADEGFAGYRDAVEGLAARIGALHVRFTGRIPEADLDGWYERADVYLGLSVHEGFCAPLVEALAHGLPVVCRAAGAVPETVGGAGIVLEEGDLALFAEALHEVVSSPGTRQALAAAAEQRLAELRPEAVVPRIRDALRPILGPA
jgi:glycosyltransferase involved in cell wall biosynthesis